MATFVNTQFYPTGQYYLDPYTQSHAMTGYGYNEVYHSHVQYSNGGYDQSTQSNEWGNDQAWHSGQADWQAGYHCGAQQPYAQKHVSQETAASAVNLDNFSDWSDSDSDVELPCAKEVAPGSPAMREMSGSEPAFEPPPEEESDCCDADVASAAEPASEPMHIDSEAAASGRQNLETFSDWSDDESCRSDEEPDLSTPVKSGLQTVTSDIAVVKTLISSKPPREGVMNLHQLLAWRFMSSPPEETCPVAEVVVGVATAAANLEEIQIKKLAKPGNRPILRKKNKGSNTKPPTMETRASTTTTTTMKIETSESSWGARQKTLKMKLSSDVDAQVARAIKSILNKLTLEKFDQLQGKMLDCGISKSGHVELLIQEVFDKATTQHHFIDMYADLCVLLHEHLATATMSDDPKFSFRRMLLDECQASFDRFFTPPANLDELDAEEQEVALKKYKTKMLGNIRFVGALMNRKMLSSKVMMVIMEELLHDPTPQALECLAAFLTVVGGTFDRPDWPHYVFLKSVFSRVQNMVSQNACQPREKCLLKDVLDLRAARWTSNRVKPIERPMTLDEVALNQAREEKSSNTPSSIRSPKKVSELEKFKFSKAEQKPTIQKLTAQQKPVVQLKPKIDVPSPKVSPASKVLERPAPKESFDEKNFRTKVRAIISELRYAEDVVEATDNFSNLPTPPLHLQPVELCELFALVAQEGKAEVRTKGFKVILGLCGRSWSFESLTKGLVKFVEDVCPDLCYDVPGLRSVLLELNKELASLVANGNVSSEVVKALIDFEGCGEQAS